MTVFDQGWLSFGGDPTTGKAPTHVIVKAEPGVVMNPLQESGVAHAYKLFCDAVKVSSHPEGYHVQNRVLADGTTVRTESNQGRHRVFVRLFGKAEEVELLRGFIAKPVVVIEDGTTFTYDIKDPALMKYIADETKWAVVKQNFKMGASTGYFVPYTPDRIPEEPKPDYNFFDVVFVNEAGALWAFWTDAKGVGAKRLIAALPEPGRVPVTLLPANGYYGGADEPLDDYHVFPLGSTGVIHVPGSTGAQDEEFVVETVIDPRIPPTAEVVGIRTFGFNPLTETATIFGMDATFFGQFQNLYRWYAQIKLNREAPYLVTTGIVADPAPYQNFHIAFSLTEHATISTSSSSEPGPYPSSVPTSLTIADAFTMTYAITSTDFLLGINYWQGTEGSPIPITGNLEPSGTHDTQELTTSGFLRYETINVGTQLGVGVLRCTANVGIHYRRVGSHVFFGYKSDPLSYPGIRWVWLDNPDDLCATAGWGNSEMITRNNDATTVADYTLTPPGGASIPLFTCSATLSWSQSEYTASVPAGVDTHAGDYPGTTTAIFPLYFSDPNPELTYIRSYGLSEYATQHYAPESGDEFFELASARVTCRDYLYHDIVNDVAIYVQAVGEAPGSWTLTLEVVARGVPHTIPLASYAGTAVNFTRDYDSFVYGDPYNVEWFDAPGNPANYTPVCEQGAFKCIAYTTAAEEALGVPRRFTLALPLSIYGRGMTPEMPEHAYPFVLENFSEASRYLTGGVWADILGHVFFVHITHDGVRDWVVDLSIDGDVPPHWAHCYRV